MQKLTMEDTLRSFSAVRGVGKGTSRRSFVSMDGGGAWGEVGVVTAVPDVVVLASVETLPLTSTTWPERK